MGAVSQQKIIQTLSIIEERGEDALESVEILLTEVEAYAIAVRPMLELEAQVQELRDLVQVLQAENEELKATLETETDSPNESTVTTV